MGRLRDRLRGPSHGVATVAVTEELRLAEVRATPDGMTLDIEIRSSVGLSSVPESWVGADIRLGLHWLDAGGGVLVWDGPRTDTIPLAWVAVTPFRRSLAVGPPPPGAAELRVELVAEAVMWGEAAGLAPLRLDAGATPRPAPMTPRERGPAPPAEAPAATREWLAAGWPRNAAAREMADYVGADLARFLMSVQLLPAEPGRILEVGSNPYFISRLIRRLHPGSPLRMTNYFGTPGDAIEQEIVDAAGTVLEIFRSELVDTETTPLPYADASFDTVLLCEVIEHLIRDPAFQLAEIARVMCPDGTLILTTPNVARDANRARLAQRQGVYDPYSGYGPHGRHNREYTAEELLELTAGAGFEATGYLTRPVHTVPDPAPAWFRAADDDGAGDYHFLTLRRREGAVPAPYRPAWLYR